MRALLLASLLLAAPALAGCLQPAGEQPPGGTPTPRVEVPQAAPLAFHAWSTCGMCEGAPRFESPEQRLFLAFEDGTALLLAYNPAQDARYRFAPDVVGDLVALEALLAQVHATQPHFRAGAWVAEVRHATLPSATLAALREALREDWTPPAPLPSPTCMDCPGLGTYGHHDNGTWPAFSVVGAGQQDDPQTASFLRLDHAFRAAEAVLDPQRAPTAPPPPRVTPVGDCMQWTVEVDPSSAPADAVRMEVRATLRNACERDIVLDAPPGCPSENMQATLVRDGRTYTLGNGPAFERPSCPAFLPEPLRLAPGAERSASWRWNGTILEMPEGECCERWTRGEAGTYEVVVRASADDGHPRGRTTLTLNGPPTP